MYNKEYYLKYIKPYRKNEQNRIKINKYQIEWYKKNKDKSLKYYQEHKLKILKQKKEYRIKFPEKSREIENKRKDKLKRLNQKRKASRNYYWNHQEDSLNKNKKYIKKYSRRDYVIAKNKARMRTLYLIKKLNLKSLFCLNCGSLMKKVRVHHISYEPNIAVFGICTICHNKLHQRKSMEELNL